MGSGGHERKEKKKIERERERGWKYPSHMEIANRTNLRDFPTVAPLPKKRVRLQMKKRHEMQEIKANKHGKLGRTKEKAGRVGYLSSLRRPVAREDPQKPPPSNAGNVLLLLRHKKVNKSPLLA